MKMSRAQEIMKGMFAWHMYDIGVEDHPPAPLPDDLSLADMLKANDTIRRHRDRAMARAKATGGKVSFGMTIDPRGIAALYVAMHYSPDHTRTVIQHGDSVVMVLSRRTLEANAKDHDDDDD